MKKKIIRSNGPLYLIGLTWLFYALFFPLYRWYHFAFVAVLSIVIYILGEALAPRKEVVFEEPKPPVHTGSQEADSILMQGREYIRQMNALNVAIPDERVSAQIDQLVLVCDKIFTFVENHIKKVRDIKVFMNYYLPTTVKIIETYKEMDGQAVRGENITGTMEKIKDALDTSVKSFTNLLDDLYGDKAMDVSADIVVLQNMLERQGLAESDISMKRETEE